MIIRCLYDKLVPIKDLVPHPDNPNDHPEIQIKRLAEILEYQGWRYPIKVSKASGFITSGHGRLEAAKLNGWTDVPVNFQEYESSAQEYADLVADNSIQTWAEIKLDLVEIGIKKYEISLDDIPLLGLKELDGLLPNKLEPGCDEDEVPEHVEPKTRLGDVYPLGNHRLMCGDSTSIDSVEKLMNGEKADMVFTDPPYRMEAEGGSNQFVGKAARKLGEAIKHLCDFDPEGFLNTLPTVFDKNKMNAYVFCNKDLVPDYLKWGVDAGYSFNILFWKKPNAIPLGGSHRPDVEYLLLFRKSAIWNNAIPDVNYSKCLEFKRELSKDHPTLKPVELICNEIQISSNPNSPVLDLFGGSGSTLIACEKTNRRCFMMELDPHYCDIIVARWEKYTGKKAELVKF